MLSYNRSLTRPSLMPTLTAMERFHLKNFAWYEIIYGVCGYSQRFLREMVSNDSGVVDGGSSDFLWLFIWKLEIRPVLL